MNEAKIETVDRVYLNWLQEQAAMKAEQEREYTAVEKRLRHLLSNKYIASFDEKDFVTGAYKKDITTAGADPETAEWVQAIEYDYTVTPPGQGPMTFNGNPVYECSACHSWGLRRDGNRVVFVVPFDYCPVCGRKMTLKEDLEK